MGRVVFHKLLDVFITAVIFVLGLALMYVLLNYALSKVSYSVIFSSGYPHGQYYQLKLYHRDYGVLYMTDKMPFQESYGFIDTVSSYWVQSEPYFIVSNHKQYTSNNFAPMPLIEYPDQQLLFNQNNNYPAFEVQYNHDLGGFNIDRYTNRFNMYTYAEFYPLFADFETAGYYTALFNPTIYPFEKKYDDELLKSLYYFGIISKSTLFVNGYTKKPDFSLMSIILGGLKYSYAPIPFIGYSQKGNFYSPSTYRFVAVYDNNIEGLKKYNRIVLKTVSMERNELTDYGDYRGMTLYYWYDVDSQKWKPLIFGNPNYKNTVLELPAVFSAFYTVKMIVPQSKVEYKISATTINNFDEDKGLNDKFLANYYVVGNPIFSVDDSGNLRLISNNSLFIIQEYNYPHAGNDAIVFRTWIKNEDDDYTNKLNNLNVP